MHQLWWDLLFYNFITPIMPYPFFPLRLGATAAAVTIMPWWMALLVANAVGGLAMIPLTLVYRRVGAQSIARWAERYALLRWLMSLFSRHMFWLQVALNFTLLPDHVSCALAGSVRYPLWRMFVAQLIGRTAHNLPIVLFGAVFATRPEFIRFQHLILNPIVLAVSIGLALVYIAVHVLIATLEHMVTMWLGDDET